jgi:hypothetical protein
MDATLGKGYFLAMQLAIMKKHYDSLSEGVRAGGFLDAMQEGGLPIRVLGFGE